MGQWSKVDGKWVELVVHTCIIVEVVQYGDDVQERLAEDDDQHCAVLEAVVDRGDATRERWMWGSSTHEHCRWVAGSPYDEFGWEMMQSVMAMIQNSYEANEIACSIGKELADTGAVSGVPEYGLLEMAVGGRELWRNLDVESDVYDAMKAAYAGQGLGAIERMLEGED